MKVHSFIIFFSLFGCKQIANTNVAIGEVCTAAFPKPASVIIKIDDISSSRLKDGEVFTTEGYMYLNMEDVAIYPNNQKGNFTGAYWLNFTDSLNKRWNELKKMSGKRVILTGRINFKQKGHLNSYSGEIDSIFCVKTIVKK